MYMYIFKVFNLAQGQAPVIQREGKGKGCGWLISHKVLCNDKIKLQINTQLR